MLQHAATRCNTLQHTSGAGQLGQDDTNNRGDAANEMADNLVAVNIGLGRYCYTLQHTATRCNTLRRTAMNCNTFTNKFVGDLAAVILGAGPACTASH